MGGGLKVVRMGERGVTQSNGEAGCMTNAGMTNASGRGVIRDHVDGGRDGGSSGHRGLGSGISVHRELRENVHVNRHESVIW